MYCVVYYPLHLIQEAAYEGIYYHHYNIVSA